MSKKDYEVTRYQLTETSFSFQKGTTTEMCDTDREWDLENDYVLFSDYLELYREKECQTKETTVIEGATVEPVCPDCNGTGLKHTGWADSIELKGNCTTCAVQEKEAEHEGMVFWQDMALTIDAKLEALKLENTRLFNMYSTLKSVLNKVKSLTEDE